MSKVKAYFRAYMGYCPNCNLDAPAIDMCDVCCGYRGDWPPTRRLAAHWLAKHFFVQDKALPDSPIEH